MVYVESAVRSRQIVAAARAVITRDGVAAATIRAVSKEAGIPLGTLQYVFPTKQQLMRAVIENLVAEIGGILRSSAPLDAGLEHALDMLGTEVMEAAAIRACGIGHDLAWVKANATPTQIKAVLFAADDIEAERSK